MENESTDRKQMEEWLIEQGDTDNPSCASQSKSLSAFLAAQFVTVRVTQFVQII